MSYYGKNELPWEEKVVLFQINPDAASRSDIARLAEELIEAQGKVVELRGRLKIAQQDGGSPWRGIVVCPEGSYYCNDKNEVVFTDKITTRDIAITRELFSCGEEG